MTQKTLVRTLSGAILAVGIAAGGTSLAAPAANAVLGSSSLPAPEANATLSSASLGSLSANGVPAGVWDQVAQCESGGNWHINTGNGFYGGLQFAPQTWDSFGGGEFAETADRATREQQIIIAERVLAVQGPGAWPTCGGPLA